MTKAAGNVNLKRGFAVIKMVIYLVSVTVILNGHTLLRKSGANGISRNQGRIENERIFYNGL